MVLLGTCFQFILVSLICFLFFCVFFLGGQDGVVWLNNGGWDLWGWVDGEFQFWFLSVVNAETFHEEWGESRSGTTTEAVEDEETLETGTLVSQFTDSVQYQVNDFLTNGVVTSGVVVGGILLSGDELFWVEQLSVCTGSDLICKIKSHKLAIGEWALLHISRGYIQYTLREYMYNIDIRKNNS